MDMMTQQPNFVGGKYIYSSTDDCHDPKTMSFADPAFTDVTKIESIRDLGITDDLGSGEIFKGAYGVDFSPVITVSSIKYILLYLYLHFISLYQCRIFPHTQYISLGPRDR